MSGPLSPSSWMSVVRLTDIFLREGERVGVGEGVGWNPGMAERKEVGENRTFVFNHTHIDTGVGE